jgi:nitrate/TMAO reductase-like tetraheme cytochrome c subunit
VQWVQARIGPRANRFFKFAFKFALTLFLLLLVLGTVGFQYSANPKFCITCHYMQPYYDSWQHSSHKDVRCVDCHYAPGIQNEFHKKFEALNQVTRYITRQYGTRPATQVEDASCLRSGCHEVRLLRGKVKFNDVEFDHMPHLTRFRRVTQLRCTSCHAQMVQGQHMTVTESTCFTCHFKPGATREEETNLANCTVCHKQPVKSAKFDHGFVQERNVSCTECHANVVQGAGEVPRDRCQLCHSEQKHIDRYDDVAFMHENHVTERKIECRQCHNTILHQNEKNDNHFTAGNKGTCNTCHDSKHDTIALLYSGNGGTDVTGAPDPMHRAGVSCQGCHRSYEKDSGETFSAAGAAGCMLCHGESYGTKLTAWHREFDEPVAKTYDAIAGARTTIAGKARPGATAQIDKAYKNISFLKKANGIHNPQYARDILRTAVTQANRAFKEAGISRQLPMPRPAADLSTSECAKCHFKPPKGTLKIFGSDFNHARHTENARLECTTCHRDNAPQRDDHGKLKLTQDDCRNCHHSRPKGASPHPTGWTKTHGAQAAKNRQDCATCHTQNQCNTCHGGLAMPHSTNWKKEHGPKSKQNMDTCRRCHQQSECTTCHQTKRPHSNDWTPQHGKQAMASPGKCATCHQQTDCSTCHKDGLKPASHDKTWPKGHPAVGKQKTALCELCHAKQQKQDVCTTCHGGVQMPHDDDFKMGGHSTVASFDAKASCFKCHTQQDTCSMCHGD